MMRKLGSLNLVDKITFLFLLGCCYASIATIAFGLIGGNADVGFYIEGFGIAVIFNMAARGIWLESEIKRLCDAVGKTDEKVKQGVNRGLGEILQ
jgi:hypothetical protein